MFMFMFYVYSLIRIIMSKKITSKREQTTRLLFTEVKPLIGKQE